MPGTRNRLPQELGNRTAQPSKEQTPSVSLPKIGGAIRGMGEKFAANVSTGTGSLSLPIATTPGRNGFGPELSLSYDSGSGNSAFGLGWTLPIPNISYRTDRGLPELSKATDSPDVFLLAGHEDLVRVLVQSVGGQWMREAIPPRVVNGITYAIERYRPRTEGMFARIERWRSKTSPEDTFWRTISKDNVTTWFGRTENSRIADPEDASRIFTWLVCESYDDKGNVISYEYKRENSDDVISVPNEKNRTNKARSANRHLKHIRYGNHEPYFPELSPSNAWPELPSHDKYYFEVVFDYGEHDPLTPTPDDEIQPWPLRLDPYSSYRSGFEIRTYRLCKRVLMFHQFPELAGSPVLVASTDLTHQPTKLASYLQKAQSCGYARNADGSYRKKSMPPLEFEYSEVSVDESAMIRSVSEEGLVNLPQGIDGSQYSLVDLDGEGLSGILTRQGGGWFYKRNVSPITLTRENGGNATLACFAAAEPVFPLPSLFVTPGLDQQFVDLGGDGALDAVSFSGAAQGFFERSAEGTWNTFVPFRSLPNIVWNDPNIRFVDVTGDGHADLVVTDDEVLIWYRSLAKEGFGPPEEVRNALDEEDGPRCVFGDRENSIFLADMSGDGLADIVRIHHREVCYWPNRGYGRFGPKVTMDNIPEFDCYEHFDATRIRLADIDGTGTTDIIYLAADGPHIYFNESGNGWSEPTRLHQIVVDNLSSVIAADLLSDGTACLVWSSPSAMHVQRPLKYIQLMQRKPHLLVAVKNNLGAEIRVRYAPSTKFYLADQQAGTPWITRLPFSVQVVESVETYDWISRSRFVTRYAYHHGFFDRTEREFHGFGMVEQWDAEEFASFTPLGEFPIGENEGEISHVPPARTKTWFHTGAFLEGEGITLQFAREYFGAPLRTETNYDAKFENFLETLLPDTITPPGLSVEEVREACRALRGSMLRQEVYADEHSLKTNFPYTVAEHNYTVECLQASGDNPHSVFFTHPRESISYHFERNLSDPRVGHEIVLKVDAFGNVERSVSIGYQRRNLPPGMPEQGYTHVTLVASRLENRPAEPDWYRVGAAVETRTFEVVKPPNASVGKQTKFQFEDVRVLMESLFPSAQDAPSSTELFPCEDWSWRQKWNPTLEPGGVGVSKLRLIEHQRMLYINDDLTGPMPLGQIDSLALPFESYRLALTPGLTFQVYGAKVTPGMLADEARFVSSIGDPNSWIPSGRIFYSPNQSDTSALEVAHARKHFYLPFRYRDPFHTALLSTETIVGYDLHDLRLTRTRDALANSVAAEFDYRVLQARLVTDANGNRTEVTFDTLGMVVATAVMGKELEGVGDTLIGFEPDMSEGDTIAFFDSPDPHSIAPALLREATTRVVYDLGRYMRTQQIHPAEPDKWEPACSATLARETHSHEAFPPQGLKIQISFSNSDGFGREIQKKVQAEPGSIAEGGPSINPRWVGSGWTIFNNKGKPVRNYEPFFSASHGFEFAQLVGVSPVLFYDPLGRVVATLHPDHTYEKVLFDPWQQATWDANDTLELNPSADLDVRDFFTRLPDVDYLPTWFQSMSGSVDNDANQAALRTKPHASTPTIVHFDALGSPFLTVSDNGTQGSYETRVELDIERNERSIINALGRTVMRYDYDLLGNRIHQESMDAGSRWILCDAIGKPIRTWDDRGFVRRMNYDALHRSIGLYVTESTGERLAQLTTYGESKPTPEGTNHRGKVWQVRDDAGVVTSVNYDFKGNLLNGTRDLRTDYKTPANWDSIPAPAISETFSSSSNFDALGRVVESVSPDGSIAILQYNEANLLHSVSIRLRGAPTVTPFVRNIEYDAKGQRTLTEYNLDAIPFLTIYEYDRNTSRLTHLLTVRPNLPDVTERTLQDLHYTYDPVGNITHVRDDAQQAIFFRNRKVDPTNDYVYDAIYRLIQAQGREHLGQSAAPTPPDPFNTFHVHQAHPGDGNAMGTYVETFTYDNVGNITSLRHDRTDAAAPGWTRSYAYNEASLIEPTHKGNRLSQTTVGDPLTIEPYTHDAHGNMIAMSHLGSLDWTFKDELTSVDLLGGGRAFYVYDSSGQRVRKVVERLGATTEERIYLGGYEVFRKKVAGTLSLERETLHVMDDKQHIAIVETRIAGDDASPLQLIRYQLGNHLGSSAIELDDDAKIISYEEYFAYGITSYQGVDNTREVPLKRYRYTGMERDEETGLSYHGARYYAPWLARWTSADPSGTEAGSNLFEYCHGNPTRFVDIDGRDPSPSTAPIGVGNLAQPPLVIRIAKAVLDELGTSDSGRDEYAPSGEVMKNLGFLFGAAQSAIPLGVGSLIPSPAPKSKAFETGRGSGQMVVGVAQITAGGTEVGGGVAGAPETVGVSALAVPSGLVVAATGMVNSAAGAATLLNASKLPSEISSPKAAKSSPSTPSGGGAKKASQPGRGKAGPASGRGESSADPSQGKWVKTTRPDIEGISIQSRFSGRPITRLGDGRVMIEEFVLDNTEFDLYKRASGGKPGVLGEVKGDYSRLIKGDPLEGLNTDQRVAALQKQAGTLVDTANKYGLTPTYYVKADQLEHWKWVLRDYPTIQWETWVR